MCTIIIKAIDFAFHHLGAFKHQQNNRGSSYICTIHVKFMYSAAEAKIQQRRRGNRTRSGGLKRWFPLCLCADYSFIIWQLVGWWIDLSVLKESLSQQLVLSSYIF